MPRVLPDKKELTYAKEEYQRLFGEAASIPVSFQIAGKAYFGFGEEFTVEREVLPAGTQVGTTFEGLRSYRSLSDYGEKITARHPCGVTAMIKTAVYEDYGTFEWAVTFKNEGSTPSPVLSEICAADLRFEGKDPYLQHFIGDDNLDQNAMRPEEILLRRGIAVDFQPIGGKPTYLRLPFYRLSVGEKTTVISVGWPGQWKARFDALANEEAVHFTAGQATFSAYLLPGEEIRTPMMTLLYACCRADDKDGEMRLINLWRRFLIDCNMRRIDGELMPPVSTGSTAWIYNEMRDSTDENQMAALDFYYKNGLNLNYWWMDAGWYLNGENERISSWWDVGAWKVDENRFPSGMRAVSEHGAKHSTKTLLWFEPERATPGTFPYEQKQWKVSESLMDMGNPEFRAWMQERVFSILEKGGMSMYRQDLNINPLPHWQQADEKRGPNRNGICENHYVTGYLSYWDAIIARFPKIMIDSCAGGGRRNDLETMRRSVSIHKTDADYSNFQQKQAMHHSFYQWLPYFGTLVVGLNYEGNPHRYAYRSAQVPWFAYTFDVRTSHPKEEMDAARTMMKEWQETNMFFYGDYYPLTGWSNNEKEWLGWEFFDEEKGGGILQIFRRAENEETEKNFRIRGVDSAENYRVQDYDGRIDQVFSGEVLKTQGLNVQIPEKNGSALIKLTRCE